MLGNSLNGRLLTDLKNTFTYEFWVLPESVHRIDQQTRDKPAEINGKNYIIGPAHGVSENDAGISVSVGLNGITVYEHTEKNIYAVLSYEGRINDLIHIAVVYDNREPQLYINGKFVKKGERSSQSYVSPAGMIGGQPGLFFNGDINEIRLWDHCRTEQNLNGYLNKKLTGSEAGLYGIWPAPPVNKLETQWTITQTKNSQNKKDLSTKENQNVNTPVKKKQDIEVSIIIPSLNKYPLNLLTLYSLEHQTFNPSKMEVIFIDDASTDQTEEKLHGYTPPYHFKYIRNKKNLGRAKVRNLGIRSARGNILIFLDAEMITEPDFVENHHKLHHLKNNLILSGAMHSKVIYSSIFPEFTKNDINKITTLTKNNKVISSRLKNFKYPCEEPYPLLEKSDIAKQVFKDLGVEGYPWFQSITRNFAADLGGFEFPWMAFLTGNVSIRKELIIQAGLLDEDFVQYGYEDWELGYRLYKMGANYIVRDDLKSYHQEHPVGKSKWKEAINNLGLFINKHHDIDILILGLEISGLADLLTMNKVLREYKLLLQSYPERFQEFQEKFIHILETIVLILQVDIRHINILGAAGYSSVDRKELQADINSIKGLKKFTNLTYLLEKVMNS
ncbi:glycosyltransferase [Neobacillus drentensis]|uniref:glycosyltransferase n=1 Tax=Neobacillus drentensis TaxID=220684 RepID=UPI00286743E4|nr:glycosyltransferase [Neobacillus drentensis]MDR7240039.1 GT2 family glycosyltransferase [Neobacillus drentensis]